MASFSSVVGGTVCWGIMSSFHGGLVTGLSAAHLQHAGWELGKMVQRMSTLY